MAKTIKNRKTLKVKKSKKVKKTLKNSKRRKTNSHRRKRYMKGGQDNECPVCFEDLGNPVNDITLNCSHKFHKRCINNTCRMNLDPHGCKCPLCRTPITRSEMNAVGYSPPQANSRYNEPPRIRVLEEFIDYINQTLYARRADSVRGAFDALENTLEEFVETENSPADEIRDEIMEFELHQEAGNVFFYEFTGIVEEIPANRANRKYFQYIFHEGAADEVIEDLVEV